jgi:hypothetical protein
MDDPTSNSIEVNLRILQQQELERLSKFADSFRESVEVLNRPEGLIGRLAKITEQLSATPSAMGGFGTAAAGAGGHSVVMGPGYTQMSRSEELAQAHAKTQDETAQKNAYVQEDQQKRIQEVRNIMSNQVFGGGPLARLGANWSMAGPVVTDVEQANLRMWPGGPPRAQDIFRNISHLTGNMAFRDAATTDASGAVTGYDPSRVSKFWMGASMAAGIGGLAATQLDHASPQRALYGAYNTPIMGGTGMELGYGRSDGAGLLNPLGQGWAEGVQSRWESFKVNPFGLNPLKSNSKELAEQFASEGLSLRDAENQRYYDRLLDIQAKTGVNALTVGQWGEGTKRWAPDQWDKMTKELDKFGEAARAANMGLTDFTSSIFEAAASMGDRYGQSRAQYVKGLREFTNKTGLDPAFANQLTSNKNLVMATMARTGKSFDSVTKNPAVMLDTSLDMTGMVMGADLKDFHALSKEQQTQIRDRFGMLQDMGLQEYTGGLPLEVLLTGAYEQDANKKGAKSYLKGKGRFGKDGDGSVNAGELSTALSKYYRGNEAAVAQFKAAHKGETTQEMADSLYRKTGAKPKENKHTIEVKLKGAAKDLLEFGGGGSIAKRSISTLPVASHAIQGAEAGMDVADWAWGKLS